MPLWYKEHTVLEGTINYFLSSFFVYYTLFFSTSHDLEKASTTHTPYLHGVVELVRGCEDVDVCAGHPEGRHVFCHPAEAGTEAIGALNFSRPRGPDDRKGRGVCLR